MNTLFAVVCLFWFIVPGLIIHQVTPKALSNPILIPIGSWVFLTLVFAAARIVDLSVDALPYMLYGAIVAFILWSKYAGGCSYVELGRSCRRRKDVIVVALAVVGIYSVYQLWAGVYIEIPADIYSHLDKLHAEFNGISDNGKLREWEYGGVEDIIARHWYVIFGYLIFHSGSRVQDVYPLVAYINSILLLLSIYYAGLYIFSRLRCDRRIKLFIAFFSVLFFVLHFGVNVFSYVRYYALAPTMTAYVMFLGAGIVSLEFFRGRLSAKEYFVAFGLMTVTCAIVHFQEAIFSIVIAWALSLVIAVQGYMHRNRRNTAQNNGAPGWPGQRGLRWAVVMGMGGVVGGAIVFLAALLILERNEPAHPWLTPVSTYLPFVKHLFILNPRYQLFHVFAVWGYLVYILFLVKSKDFASSPLILAGMIVIPLATVLNPAFVDLYLRLEKPFTLYRMMYMIPLYFVGAYFLVFYSRSLFKEARVIKKVCSGAVMVLLLAVLMPFDIIYAENRFSRVHTLLQSYEDNLPHHWTDLIAELRNFEREKIVTDPVTGYVVNGLTKHEVRTRKYVKVEIELDDQEYEDDRTMFAKYDGYLLIINLRDGEMSKIGRLSGHWRANILDTSTFYSDGLIRFVRDEEQMFLPMWHKDGISIYRINYANS